ncbi:LacI family DNA-binding transcriptional regulator [Rhizobium sp. S96]|uniref:LacI family DNA-binding transcriptional regulator n=1 Tax=Rhizobium sp. S96 TaxID=3055140 RepID=UPI0025AA8275|nr:LacI family DNA-binding transcriptional regulator [Rhizobium sp. S96]MDM9623969.1 LacI family DNA-binding transcriptional regulator [Rhizobium sp. S96]
MNKRITSKELAKLAGVSSATISRAFSSDSRISAETRNRILSIAQEHDYQPNALARSLNSQRSGLVALVVNSIQNPPEAEQLQYLVQRLQTRELLPIILCCSGYDDKAHLMRMASAYQVDHVVVFSDMVSYDDAIQIFRSARPIIVSSEPLSGKHASHINIDGSNAVREVIDKAVADGRKHFAYLTGRKSSWIDKQRKQWFADALRAHGLAFEAEAHGDYSYDSGFKEAVVLLRRSKVDTVICGNDVMAIGVRDAATRVLGKRVPEDVAVVGQDGISMADWECLDLTTIALDAAGFIDEVVRLIERDQSQDPEPERVVLDLKVRWGSTC